jgi:hypothetical protein
MNFGAKKLTNLLSGSGKMLAFGPKNVVWGRFLLGAGLTHWITNAHFCLSDRGVASFPL